MKPRNSKWDSRVITAVLAIMFSWSCPDPASAQIPDPRPEPYLKVIEDTENGTIRLDLAVRLFAPAGDEKNGPAIACVGAIHIAEPEFYQQLQKYLDQQNLVLYEGVKPRGFGNPKTAENTTPEVKRRQTEIRLRFLAIMLERTKSSSEGYPESLATLTRIITEKAGRRVGEWVQSSQNDAWGTPLDFQLTADRQAFTLRSYAADKKPGGTGPAADLTFAEFEPLNDAEIGNDPGIQSRLAQALGLTFQLEIMDEEKPHYRNVDMSIDEIEAAVAKGGGDASFLFNLLDGSSLFAGVMKFGFAIIEKSPRLQALTKIILMETLKIVGENGLGQMKNLPENMAPIFKVIIHQRNQVVIDELKTILEKRQVRQNGTIAVIYGAGHLEDLEIQLAEQCGYQPIGEFWLTAINVDIKKAGLTNSQIKMIRAMVSQMN